MVQASRVAAVLCLGFSFVVLLQLRALWVLTSTPALPHATAAVVRDGLRNSLPGSGSDGGHGGGDGGLGSSGRTGAGGLSEDLMSLELHVQHVVAETKARIAEGGGGAEMVASAKAEIDGLRAEVDHKMHLVKELQAKQTLQHQHAEEAAQAVAEVEEQNHHHHPEALRATDQERQANLVAALSHKPVAAAAVISKQPAKGQAAAGDAGGKVAVVAGVNDGSSPFAPTPDQRSLGLDSPVLVLCYGRDDYLTKTLETILRYHPSNANNKAAAGPVVPIVVSQDGNIEKVNRAIERMRARFFQAGVPFAWLKHPKAIGAKNGYEKLAQHFGWAFQTIFANNPAAGTDIYAYPPSSVDVTVPRAARVIVLEEDIEIAPDFFGFFGAMAPLLDADDKLFSVSAWNDNGFASKVEGAHPDSVVRSDFFPGLGWMLNRQLWAELGGRWPSGYWDDWIREPAQRKGREVLRPELCRTYHFGAEGGTSAGQFNQYLKSIRLNKDPVAWGAEDLRYLSHDTFVTAYKQQLEMAAKVATLADVERLQHGVEGHLEERYYRIEYTGVTGGAKSFMRQAKLVGLMDNEKAMVPRGAFKGVVQFRHAGGIVLLAPDPASIDWESCGGRCS